MGGADAVDRLKDRFSGADLREALAESIADVATGCGRGRGRGAGPAAAAAAAAAA